MALERESTGLNFKFPTPGVFEPVLCKLEKIGCVINAKPTVINPNVFLLRGNQAKYERGPERISRLATRRELKFRRKSNPVLPGILGTYSWNKVKGLMRCKLSRERNPCSKRHLKEKDFLVF